MSKKYGIMDFPFQIWNLTRHIRCYSDFKPDTIDLHSFDRTLHLQENLSLLNQLCGISPKKKEKYYSMQSYNLTVTEDINTLK